MIARTLKYVLAFAALLLGAGLAVLARPELVVNGRTGGWALKRFGAAFSPRWAALEVGVESAALLDKTLVVRARGLCLAGTKPPWTACFKRVHARLGARVSRKGLEELRLEELDVDGGPVRADLARPSPPRTSRTRREPEIPAWLGALRVGRIEVALPDNRLALADGSASGALELRLPASAPRALTLRVDGRRARRGETRRLSVSADILTDAWEGRLTRLELAARALAEGLDAADLTARARPLPGGRAALAARASARANGRVLRLSLDGSGDRRSWTSSLRATFEDPLGAVRTASLDACRLELGLAESARPERASLACRYSLAPDAYRSKLDRPLLGRIEARATLARGRDLDGALSLTVEPTGDWYRVSGRLDATAKGRLDRGAGALALRHNASLSLEVPDFGRVVTYFRDTAFAVPAPLNAMSGPVSLKAGGSGDSRLGPQRFRIEAQTALRDGPQRARTRLSGDVLVRDLWTPERRFEADGAWELLDVAFQLPYLELQAPPKVAVDPRIRSSREEELRLAPAPKPRPLPFALALRVRTPEQPVRLHTNLLEEPVPLRMDLFVSTRGASGELWTERFPLELFRRRAVVERFRVVQRPGSKAGQLDAAIHYRTPNELIRILLLGTTEKPRVQFESEPPLDRHQILSLLLFGKPPSELGSDEAASVGHTNAALAEQTFGLASLFLFASTPIEYVGYNPETQSYIVRFRLPGGATAELGADLEERRRLLVRKRLARHWALETELRREVSTERNAVTTLLQWFRRY